MNFSSYKKIIAQVSFAIIVIVASVHVSIAQTNQPPQAYTPLAPLYLPQSQQLPTDLAGFVVTGFRLAVAASAALAVIMIIVGGLQYMSTDLISKKGDARKTIQQALLGLLLVMMSYLVLRTINPKLVDISLITGDLSPATQQPKPKVITDTGHSGEVNTSNLQQYSFKASNGIYYSVTGLKDEDLNSLHDSDFYTITFIKSNTEYYTDTLEACQAYDQTHVTTPCHAVSDTTKYWLMCNGASWCTTGQRATGDDYATQAACDARAAQEPGKLSCVAHAYGYALSINNGTQTQTNLTLGACNYYKSTWATNNPGQTTSDCTKSPLK